MKHFIAPLSAFLTALTIIGLGSGCGGNGGGTSDHGTGNTTGATTGNTTSTTGSTTGNTTGSNSFTLSGSGMVNGGFFGNDIPAGTQTFTLLDPQGNLTTFKNILVPLALTNGGATIIRKGSLLFKGTYTGTTAQCVNGLGESASVPLNSDGSLAVDIGIDGHLIVPVSAVGALTFSNGIEIDVNANPGNNTKDVAVTFTSVAASVPTGGNTTPLTGTISLSGGTANTQLTVNATFISGDTSSLLQLSGTTFPPSKSIGATGQIVGSHLPYVSGEIGFQING